MFINRYTVLFSLQVFSFHPSILYCVNREGGAKIQSFLFLFQITQLSNVVT